MTTNDCREAVVLAEENASETKKLESAQLLKAREALELLHNYFGGRQATKKLLADMIADGELDAYARFHWTTDKRAIRPIWKAGPPEGAIERKKIKPGVFSGSSVLDNDIKRWKWRRGLFHVTHVKSGGSICRFFYKDVRFERAAIETILENQKAAFRELYKGGRRFDETRWGT
ncbi:hypothetical protein [Erythrobacter aurantius]|uniref:hypothetical protein n=1 Tax=Erythrobacter aurantius TaxID=2909249 RepID=UPI0020794C81|nr:hypothetical protein [Erythrobacter aurantius]